MQKNVVIIGAPRSGTNMLRDVLTRLSGVSTWPCDEINYIWRHGNVRYPSDEFTPEMARPEVREYVQRHFRWVAERYQAHTVVEKTCANSLRVGFVDHVVPEARYIFIRRDGLDAVGSAMKRWAASLDFSYILEKVRFVPVTDLPYYGVRYFWSRLYRLFSAENRLAFWGPRIEGMPDLLARYSLEEVCALQWKRCVDSAFGALSGMSPDRWLEICYEDFVRQPNVELARVMAWLDLHAQPTEVRDALADISDSSIGKGRMQLGSEVTERLLPLIQDTQNQFGYG
jgi:hypothetical protein